MEKKEFKRAKFSGGLDVLGFLAALAAMAGYIAVNLVKVNGLPDGLTDFWEKFSDGAVKAFDGVFLRWLSGFPSFPGLPFAVLFGFLALLLFVGCALLFAESWEASLEAGLLNVGLVKWYLLIPCAFFLLQTILKFSAHARAH